MAQIVGAFGVPHGPTFPLLRPGASAGGDEILAGYDWVRERLEKMQPDILMVITCDHLTQFFAESVPIFSIAVGERAAGPCDYRDMPQREFYLAPNLARTLQSDAVSDSFDVGMSQEIAFDHSLTVPLHFLTPLRELPVLPVYVNGFLPPLPLAARCFALGESFRRSIDAAEGTQRVVIVASGHISSEIGGPRFYLPDPAWLSDVEALLAAGEVPTLLARSTPQQLASAGNVAGEFLTWLLMLGCFGAEAPARLEVPAGRGVAFGAWWR